MNRYLSVALSALLLLTVVGNPAFAQASKAESLRRKVIEWGTNKPVAVKLNSGEKLQGRIAEIKDDALTIQFLKTGKIDTRDFRWNEIEKVSLKNSTEDKMRKTGGFIALGVLATLAVVIGIALSDPNF